MNETTRGIFDNGAFPKRLARVRNNLHARGSKNMNVYRVILQIAVDEERVVTQLGQDYLEILKEDAQDGDYLAQYVEHELGWAEQSFNRIEVEEIKRLHAPSKRRDPNRRQFRKS